MSLIPLLFQGPSRILDQHFGHGLELDDLMTSMAVSPMISRHYIRPWRSLARSASHVDSGSKITIDKDKYQVCLDVQQFTPEEITVKTVGRMIIIEGKHEEKEDEHGLISRHFIRKYQLPEGYKSEDVTSSLSSDGVLSVCAPKPQSTDVEGERNVNITHTGPAHKTIQPNQKQEQKME